LKQPGEKAQAGPPPKAPDAPAAAAPSDPTARPWAVQVAALNVRTEAEAIAKRLSSKGYAAYVVAPTDGTSVYRVRVGRFNSQREAEPLKAKLEKEEQFKPWITR
jgi:cell division septation protein DedD